MASRLLQGRGWDLGSLNGANPTLVEEDSRYLADGLRRILDRLDDGQRALAIGHSPTSEAGVFGLTEVIIEPLGKGEGVLVTQNGDSFTVSRLD